MPVTRNMSVSLFDENGQLHCDNGPAFISSRGSKFWYRHSITHRVGGPACEYFDGSEEWVVNGVRHRTDGAAVTRADGHKEWWLNGIEYEHLTWLLKVYELGPK